MKHNFSVLTSFVVVVSMIVILSVAGFAGSLKGDVNEDGKLTVVDAKWILQNDANLREFDSRQAKLGDVNSDGKVTVIDAKWVLQMIAGLRETQTDASPAESTVDDATQTEIQKPDDNYDNRTEALGKKLAEAKAIDLEWYTEETAQLLIQAIKDAEAVVAAENPSEAQIGEAAEKIDAAISGLKSFKQCLEEALAASKAYDISPCETTDVNAFNLCISSAEAILSDKASTPSQFIQAENSLADMIEVLEAYKLELAQKKQELSEALEKYRAVDTSVTRDGSAIMPQRIANYYNEIEKAQALLDNPVSKQSEINAQMRMLASTEKALKTYKEVFLKSWTSALSYYKETRSDVPAGKLAAAKAKLEKVINSTGAIYDLPETTDEDYSQAMLELSAAVKEYVEFCTANSKDAVIDWT